MGRFGSWKRCNAADNHVVPNENPKQNFIRLIIHRSVSFLTLVTFLVRSGVHSGSGFLSAWSTLANVERTHKQ